MAERVDLDGALPPVEVPGDVLHELYAHAREALPEECCGLVLGTHEEPYRRVVRCRNEMTRLHLEDPGTYPLDGRKAFWMNGADYQAAQLQAEAAGQHVTAVYHSHVDVQEGDGVYLSDMDLAYAQHQLFPFPSAAQVVIAVFDGRVAGSGAFARPGPGKPFEGRVIVSEAEAS